MRRISHVLRKRHDSHSLRVRRLLDVPSSTVDTWQQNAVGVLIVLMLFTAIGFGLMGIDLLLTAVGW